MWVKSKHFKKDLRLRKKIRIRKKISGSEEKPRLSVFKSSKYTYAQVVSDISGKTLVSASTKEKEVLDQLATLDLEKFKLKAKSPKSVAASIAVGLVLGRRLKEKKIENVVFDRNGFIFHGRIKAVAEGVREAGLKV